MYLSWRTALVLALPILILLVAAWTYAAIYGVHPEAGAATEYLAPHPELRGYSAWLRLTHFINFLFITLLARAGLQILWDHPRLYWNHHSTPGSEWLRFAPEPAPWDPKHTSMDDARWLSPWIGIPGGWHKVGLARNWHLICALFWLTNGIIYVILLFFTGFWQKLIPQSWGFVPATWETFVSFATFHMPVIPDAAEHYDPLQKLAYGSMVFIFAPLSLLTGAALSPAIESRFPWYPRLFINRQVARSIHFLLLVNYVIFTIIHVTMVYLTGFAKGMNHILLNVEDERMSGIWLGLALLVLVVAVNFSANWICWGVPRLVQRLGGATWGRLEALLLDPMAPIKEYKKEEISPYFWANGELPTREDWKRMAKNNFKDYRLKVFGLVEKPVELSLADMQQLGKEQHITPHACIQGWSGIAEWGGLPMKKLFELVRPLPRARYAVFHSYAEGDKGGKYYDSDPLSVLKHPQTILAYEMNYQPLGEDYGAPLRLRLENKLGFKMVKWIEAIEFVEDYASVHRGEGGYHEDIDYYNYRSNI